MMMADVGETKPAAGVITTRPTTIAVAAPTAVARLVRSASSAIQTHSAAIGASIVVANACPAPALADSALPALKPNQPKYSSAAPSSANGTLCGSIACRPKSFRFPTTIAATSAATPALMCTTVPPAKSSTPSLESQPPPQTQCAIG